MKIITTKYNYCPKFIGNYTIYIDFNIWGKFLDRLSGTIYKGIKLCVL